jgi:uncharacterized protein (UPF0333 family)
VGRPNLKAQGSMEFLVAISLIILFFILFIYVIGENTFSINKQKREIIMSDILNKAKEELVLAQQMHDGYLRKFIIPEKISNNEYTINIISNQLIINTSSGDYWVTIPETQGDIHLGENLIRKEKGVVYLNQ